MRKILALSFALMLVCAGAALAQFTLRSGVGGVITDSSGAVVPNVPVVLTDLDRNQTSKTTTNEGGVYTFVNLTPGRYQVSVEQTGFRKSVSDVIAVSGGQTVRVDLALAVGALTETVEVRAVSPLLQTEQSVVGQLADRALVESFPSKGRNFTNLVNLTPGVSSFSRGNGLNWAGAQGGASGTDYIVGGGGDNGFYMNGVNINENWGGTTNYTPSMEAVAEVKVDVANFSAATGRDVSSMEVTTRGGTSNYHATAFEYFQHSALNAWDPYTKMLISPDQKKTLLQRSQWGGNFGGPVVIPKIFNGREKLFFFANYERMKQNRGGESVLYRVPTAAQRQGDFSEVLRRFPGDPNYIIYDPYSTVLDAKGNSKRTPIPNNDLRGKIDTRPQQMLALWPSPNGYTNPTNAGDLNNYQSFQSVSNANWRLDTRIDYRLTDKDNVYVNISKAHGMDNNQGGLFPETPANSEDFSWIVTANYVRIFTPHLTNEFIYGKNRGGGYNVDQQSQAYLHKTDTLRNKFIKYHNTGPEDIGFGAIYVSGYPTVCCDEVFLSSSPGWQMADNVTWLRGSHTIKAGYNFVHKVLYDWDYWINVNFSSQFTRAGSLDGSLGGDGLATFLIGIPGSIRQRYKYTGPEKPLLDWVDDYWGGFVEDRWQVNPKLTVSLGLRYDLPLPVYSQNKNAAIMDFSYPGWQLTVPGRAPNVPHQAYSSDKNNFGPRISLAYRMKSDFVIRASYGIFYMSGIGAFAAGRNFASVGGYGDNSYSNATYNIPDDVPYFTWDSIYMPPEQMVMGQLQVSTGQGTGWFTSRRNVVVQDQASIVTPYYHRYLVEFQKGLSPSTALTLSYVGARGVKGYDRVNVNDPPYRTGWANSTVTNAARPNTTGRWGTVRLMRNGSNSFFNSTSIKLQRNLSKGLQVLAHYTFSKTVSDPIYFIPEVYEIGSTGGWGGTSLNFWSNRKLGRGESEFSHPHRFVSALTYTTPFGSSLPALPKALVWGWDVSVMTTFESGNALTVTNGVTSARDLDPNMPNVSGKANLSGDQRSFTRYFNTGVFSAPPQDVKGTAGVGLVRGPGMNNWDLSLKKTFRPVERLNVQFRGDMFNALNHTQWSKLNTTYNNRLGNSFGYVTQAREGRVVQLGLRVSF